jgi:chemotaxis protein MotB
MNRSNVNFLRHKIKKSKVTTGPKEAIKFPVRWATYGIASTVVFLSSTNLVQEPETVKRVPAVAETVAQIQTPPKVEVVSAQAPDMSNEEVAMMNELKSKNIKGVQDVKKDENGDVMLVLNTDQFFQLGTARIVDEKVPQLNEIAGALKASAQGLGEGAALEIESHTDDSPIVKQKHLYQSNWELSAARAASLVHLFEDAGFSKDKMKLVGYGDSRPVVPNRDPSGEPIVTNAVKNRRIVLRVYHSDQEKNSI